MQTLPRLSPHAFTGVVQYEIFAAYAASRAWKVVQNVLSLSTSHALVWAGASPNHSATWSLTSGEVIQSIHWYMQFGCFAFAETTHVSDQPVEPSVGTVDSTFAFLPALTRSSLTCHSVP